MSGLVDHARRELVLIGEDPFTIAQYLDVIEAFTAMNHSGASALHAIPILERLLRFQTLSPLTDNPSEWMLVETGTGQNSGMWQSSRNPEAFSRDGGKTYYILSERDVDPTSMHESITSPIEEPPQ